jgi:predicted ATPase
MHIPYIKLKNFRSFEEETKIEFAPITILTGPNSSGKSSILKALLLVKENLGERKDFNRLEFSSGSHFLGSFKATKNKSSKEEKISVKIPFKIEGISDILEMQIIYKQINDKEYGILERLDIFSLNYKKHLFKIDNLNWKFSINLELFYNYFSELFERNKKIKTFISQDDINFQNEIIEAEEKEKYLQQNGFNIRQKKGINLEKYDLKQKIKIQEEKKLTTLIAETEKPLKFEISIQNQIIKILLQEQSIEISSAEDFEEGLVNLLFKENHLNSYFLKNLLNKIFYEQFHPNYEKQLEEGFLSTEPFPLLLNFLDTGTLLFDKIASTFKIFPQVFFKLKNKWIYIPAMRGSTDRIYSNFSDSFLNKLLIQFSNIKWENQDPEIKFMRYWLKEFKIAEDFKVERKEGAVSIPYLLIDNEWVVLADLGYGFTQLLPIILQIIIKAKKNRQAKSYSHIIYAYDLAFLIEEPEANLHPNLQSLLADMFIDASELFYIQFIIETHSEYLVRKLQYWTAKKVIKPEDTAINYFDKGKVKRITINEDGSLNNRFGPGFFDEADNIAISLFNLQNQKN